MTVTGATQPHEVTALGLAAALRRREISAVELVEHHLQTSAHLVTCDARESARFWPVSVLETILYFVVPTVGLYALIALLAAAPRLARRPRYRTGQPWPHQPLWWTANPRGAQLPAADGHAVTGERGGARGSW